METLTLMTTLITTFSLSFGLIASLFAIEQLLVAVFRPDDPPRHRTF
ncbi:MAG: hypothetical protein ACR2P6_00085 [Gammaproteobacteria bacterium]